MNAKKSLYATRPLNARTPLALTNAFVRKDTGCTGKNAKVSES